MKILIAGISSAVGQILATALQSKGYEVCGTYHKNPVPFIDVDTSCSIDELLKKKMPNILINTIGISVNGMIENISVKDFQEVLEVNLVSYFGNIQKCIPVFKSLGGGKIVNISSIVAKTCPVGCMPYVVSKSSINTMTVCMAKEFAQHNIFVNAINLGYMGFGMGAKLPDKIKDKITGQIPLKRFGDAKSLVDSVLFLLNSDYMTGSIIDVGGGL